MNGPMETNGKRILPLELRDVTFEAGGMRLIKNMTFTLGGAGKVFILGPNGAGKSLLLRLCHGLIKPASGQVTWHGGNPKHQQAMVFQRPVMLRRTVAANIAYALKLRGIDRKDRADIVSDVLRRTGLARLAEHPARVLSFGEQQRLALARAWALRPQVLFMDEPTASLDPAATHTLEELIAAIHAEGTKIVMTTHDMGQARRLADEVLFLHRGRLLEQAPAERFFDAPENDLAQAFMRGELLWWRRRKNPLDVPHPDPLDYRQGGATP
ncbi:MAG: phosphate ABC transporter ATP-binding protein [Rhodospirillales bacterium]|nr:phosphate ABC transporter ATP-binding protein [Rhodospirillales bacterium]